MCSEWAIHTRDDGSKYASRHVGYKRFEIHAMIQDGLLVTQREQESRYTAVPIRVVRELLDAEKEEKS